MTWAESVPPAVAGAALGAIVVHMGWLSPCEVSVLGLAAIALSLAWQLKTKEVRR